MIFGLAAALVAAAAAESSASHFRGAAMVPSVSSSGLLTVRTTSFWRKGQAIFDEINPSVAGGSGQLSEVSSIDSSDARFDVLTTTHTYQLPGAGTYQISASGCCRVASGGRANWSESNWTMNSAIVWNGSSAANPIAFNFGSVQPEVSRLSSYSQNLNATSPDGLALSYNQNLNQNINFQPTPSFLVNTSTGLMTIPSSETPLITDNTTLGGQNVGADAAFSGNIVAANGSFVEFDWMFDGVDAQGVNNAPDVADGALANIVGTVFNFTFTASDPDGDPVTFDPGLFAILGPVPAIAPVFNNLTGLLTWDSAGSALGTYIFQVRGRDPGNLTDIGSLTVTLRRPQQGVVPEPASLLVHGGLLACGLLGAVWHRRKA
ncbi:MAG: hypothetical protein DCC67_18640 [Planctomycetota bacterium]|nr:MAG: hypothetical protein DCC67_18640 [Planctomycetota bacterium]